MNSSVQSSQWRFVLSTEQLPKLSQSRGVTVDERGYVVVRYGNQFFAYRNYCPHLGIALEYEENQFLDESGTLLKCSTHGALFTLDDGECVAGPCRGQSLSAIKIDLRSEGLYLFC